MNAPSASVKSFRSSWIPAIVTIAVLSIGREFFIPLALAILFAFLLRPLVTLLERGHLGRTSSVLVATLFAFSVIGGVGYLMGGQLLELASDLPKYKGHLQEKISALKVPSDGPLARAKQTLQELTKQITGEQETSGAEGKTPAKTVAKGVPSGPDGKEQSLQVTQPVPVSVVRMPTGEEHAGPGSSSLAAFRSIIMRLISPLGTTVIVIVFVIFMLMEREDLRDRVIHLCGHAHLQLTTRALDDATHRVTRYLLAQSVVNATYGVVIGLGLKFIGLPNWFLWGLLAAVLRFVPYLGAWLSSSFPLLISLAVSSGWTMPLLTFSLFIVAETLTGYVFEPWLYGSSTGLSSIAVIVAAAFWTWLWGPIGLLLSTPLTVCLAVLGKYVPSLSYLDVLLGDKPPIAPEDRFYQRLLATDEDEAVTLAEAHLKEHSLAETYERLMVPALRLVDEDFYDGNLQEDARARLHDTARNIIDDVAESAARPVAKSTDASAIKAPPIAVTPQVLCLPASTVGDELVAEMLVRLLEAQGVAAKIIPARRLASEMMDDAEESAAKVFCVSVLPGGSTRHGLYVAKRLRERLPKARILVGLWGEPVEDEHGRLRRFQNVKTDGVVTSLQDMVREITATAEVRPPEPQTAPATA